MYVSTKVQTYQSANTLIYLLIYPLIYLIIYENRCTKVPKYKSEKVYLYLCTRVLMYQSAKMQTYNSTKVLKYECTFARGPAIESLGTGRRGVRFFLPFYLFTFLPLNQNSTVLCSSPHASLSVSEKVGWRL